MSQPHLLCLGYGYSANTLALRLKSHGFKISGTSRDAQKCKLLTANGIDMHYVESEEKPLNSELLQSVTHILHSIPPRDGDPATSWLEGEKPELEWFGYLSTTGVYGDHGGNWVDEESKTQPTNSRSEKRLEAEKHWLSTDMPVHVFRLAGIYGPGRSYINTIAKGGDVQPIAKEKHVFSRCHVEDIASVLFASMFNPSKGAIFNVADDLPASQKEVALYAYKLLNRKAPETLPFEKAEISEMGKEFWADNRRVSSKKVKETLNIEWKYPTYKQGLLSIYKAL